MTSDERGNESVPNTDHGSRITRDLPAFLACASLVLLFCAAFQMDRPAIEWVRSLQGLWIERIGDAGYQIGRGVSLIIISGLFVVVGYVRARPELRLAGLWGWGAHAITGLLAQGLKRGIGRPRPRAHREDEFFTGPSLNSDLDSFPSGHASASFAVAAVVARYCPALAWPAYGLAGFISLTRVFRGSHFVSDVVAGIVLGIVVGALVATPIQEWKGALRHFLLSGTPWLIVACSVAWLAILPAPDTVTTGLLVGAGVLTWASLLLARRKQGVIRDP